MGFIRAFDQNQIQKMTGGENAELFARLKADVLNGEVFPAVRKNELHFYYKGGCLYKFIGGSFKRNKNYEKFGVNFSGLSPYEKAKKEIEIKFTNTDGKAKERRLLDGLNTNTFKRGYDGSVVVLDVEINLNGEVGRGKKCDLALLNTRTDELMFVEGKVFSDSRVNVTPPNMPEVIGQVKTYSSAVSNGSQEVLAQYANHIRIINGLFNTEYRAPQRLIRQAKLLVYETPQLLNENGKYSIKTINGALGENNVFWVLKGQSPALDEIWANLI